MCFAPPTPLPLPHIPAHAPAPPFFQPRYAHICAQLRTAALGCVETGGCGGQGEASGMGVAFTVRAFLDALVFAFSFPASSTHRSRGRSALNTSALVAKSAGPGHRTTGAKNPGRRKGEVNGRIRISSSKVAPSCSCTARSIPNDARSKPHRRHCGRKERR